jgi:hypothetical protein
VRDDTIARKAFLIERGTAGEQQRCRRQKSRFMQHENLLAPVGHFAETGQRMEGSVRNL